MSGIDDSPEWQVLPKQEISAAAAGSGEDLVKYALSIGALELVREGRKLKSGRISPYFFNSGLFKSGRDLIELAGAYVDVMHRHFGKCPNVIFGPAYKGIPLAVAVAILDSRSNIGFAFNRKEEKQYGDGGLIVGTQLKGKRVLIIDDVITDGASKREAVEIIRAQGGIPIGCVVAFDRQEKGFDKEANVNKPLSAAQEFEQMFDLPLIAAATLTDLISVLEHMPAESGDDEIGEVLEKVLAYRRQYGST